MGLNKLQIVKNKVKESQLKAKNNLEQENIQRYFVKH